MTGTPSQLLGGLLGSQRAPKNWWTPTWAFKSWSHPSLYYWSGRHTRMRSEKYLQASKAKPFDSNTLPLRKGPSAKMTDSVPKRCVCRLVNKNMFLVGGTTITPTKTPLTSVLGGAPIQVEPGLRGKLVKSVSLLIQISPSYRWLEKKARVKF